MFSFHNKTGKRRTGAQALMLAALCVALLLPGVVHAAEVMPLADNETFYSGHSGGSYFNVDTSWVHWRSDGARAYCRQRGLTNPDGAQGMYALDAWEPWEKPKIKAIFASAPSIASAHGVSGDKERALVQLAIWAVETAGDTGGYGGTPVNPASVTSSDQELLAAFHELFDAAQAGYSGQSADLSGLTDGGKASGSAFGGTFVRYGPFSVSGGSASASLYEAPAGSYIGNGAGDAIDSNAIGGQDFFLYIPADASGAANARITVQASYSTISVTKYSGFKGYQDQFVSAGAQSGTISATMGVLGFGRVQIRKADSEDAKAALAGATFAVDEWDAPSGAWRETGAAVTWNGQSRRYVSDLLFETADNEGRFRIRETSAPYGYRSGWSGEVSISGKLGASAQPVATDAPAWLRVNVQKKDKGTGKAAPQGDASLAGAVYGLYMNEDLTHPNGTALWKDQKVAEATTDEGGRLVFTRVFPANYYLKEISAPEGYVLDDAKYPIDGHDSGGSLTIERTASVSDCVAKQAFELIKGGSSQEGSEMELLTAGFRVYLISELSRVQDGTLAPKHVAWEAADFRGYDFAGERTAMVDGERLGELFSDGRGRLVSPELPYGAYVVCESTVPKGRMAIDPFVVRVSEDSREPQPWRLFDDAAAAYRVKVVKKDAGTGGAVRGKKTRFRIFDLDAGAYVKMKSTYPKVVWVGTEEMPFETTEDGSFLTPEKLPYGHYRLEEVQAPEGYVRAGHEEGATDGYDPGGHPEKRPAAAVEFSFDGRTPVYLPDAQEPVLEVSQYDEAQYGKVSILKRGAAAPGADGAEGADGAADAGAAGPLKGAVFEVVAAADVAAQDGSGTVLYKAGETVRRVTTDAQGHAWADRIPIGDYILREAEAPAGFLCAPDEAFSVTPIDQDHEVAFFSWEITDDREGGPAAAGPAAPGPAPAPQGTPKTADSFPLAVLVSLLVAAVMGLVLLHFSWYRPQRR
ncbi:MAG: prealbumin-like fold domain-containing protein [Clostridiales Family XIII bacterium]|jgi:uncharacterized surface anchored protein|nr:prealbumin-like fold domain-containing protein [Clostridiales Family XIII bacterium]